MCDAAKSLFTNVRTGKARLAKTARTRPMMNRVSTSLSTLVNVLFVAGVFGAMTIALGGAFA